MDYNNYGSSGSSNDGDDLTLGTTTYATFDGVFDGHRVANTDYGQSFGERYEDATLVDGALYRRKNNEDKLKLFSWRSLGYDDDMEFSVSDAPRVNSESFGSRTFSYELVAAVHNESGGVDIAKDELEVNEEGLPIIGSVIIWNSGSKDYGPSATAKTAARTLTEESRGAIADDSDVYAWLADDLTSRQEIVGEVIRRFKVENEGREYTFNMPVFIHKKFGERVSIKNGTSSSSPSASDSEVTEEEESEPEVEPEPESKAEESSAPEGVFSEEVDEIINYCIEQEITASEDVLGTFDVMAQNPDSQVDEEMIESAGRGNIVAAVEQRAEVA